jgi:hypothetical protein
MSICIDQFSEPTPVITANIAKKYFSRSTDRWINKALVKLAAQLGARPIEYSSVDQRRTTVGPTTDFSQDFRARPDN